MNTIFPLAGIALLSTLAAPLVAEGQEAKSGNPIFAGHYADPEANIFGDTYWIYPTYSAPYDEQLFLDGFKPIRITREGVPAREVK